MYFSLRILKCEVCHRRDRLAKTSVSHTIKTRLHISNNIKVIRGAIWETLCELTQTPLINAMLVILNRQIAIQCKESLGREE